MLGGGLWRNPDGMRDLNASHHLGSTATFFPTQGYLWGACGGVPLN